MTPEDLKKRTKEFAIKIIKLVQSLENRGALAGKIIASQLLRSGTSVAANYRAACRAKSSKDFISKIGTVIEEANESQLWLELLVAAGIVVVPFVEALLKESGELAAIMTVSKDSAIKNQYRK